MLYFICYPVLKYFEHLRKASLGMIWWANEHLQRSALHLLHEMPFLCHGPQAGNPEKGQIEDISMEKKETKKQRKQKQELGWERWGSSSLEDFSAGGFSFKITDVLYYQECGCPQPLEVYWWTVKLLKLKAALCRDASPAEQPGGLGDGFETSKQSNNKEQELQSLKRCSEHEGSEK